MSRKIAFRAWHKTEQRMYTVLTLAFDDSGNVRDGYFAIPPDEKWHHFSGQDIELMEYIDRLDHHDKEMCEGDIVEYIDNTSQGLVKKIVAITDIRHLPDFGCSKWEEIIGNIWANPELVKDE